MSAENSIAVVVKNDAIQKRFSDVLGKSAPAFISSVISTVKNTPALQKCDPMSVLTAAINAATLRLAVNPNLGQAYLVPFNNQCQLQIGWKVLVQLAQRSKRYKSITAVAVYEGEIISFNKFTEEVIYGDKISDTLVGFFARFELIDGFTKSMFWSTADMEQHALKFSKSYRYDKQNNRTTSVWSSNFEAMGIKTLLRRLLSQYGPLSIDDNAMAFALSEEPIPVNDETPVEEITVPFDDTTKKGGDTNET